MKIGILVLISLLSAGAVTCLNAASPDDSNQRCFAIIENNRSVFIFPVEQEKPWTWYNSGTKDNQLEYAWEAVVREAKGAFRLGAYLFKPPGQQGQTGSLDRLLGEAQCSVSEEEATPGGGTAPQLLKVTRITCSVMKNRVVLAVTGEGIRHLFSERPKTAYFVVQRPGGFPTRCEAPIQYVRRKGQ